MPHRVEHIERAERIDLEVGARVGDGGRDRDLGGQMNHRVEPAFAPRYRSTAARSRTSACSKSKAVSVAQPVEVLVGACPGEIVEDGDLPVPRPK